jgi:sterol desaturase/sphingolipid hydroxylase (fatty acid hydroxylase superfamily)
MQLNWIALAIPFFLCFIVWEYYASKKSGQQYFQFAESIANLNIGIGERLTDMFTTGIFYFAFNYIYGHFALFHIKPTMFTWILLFLVTDFLWYWYHRCAHQVNLFWMAHIVHHQSEDFNYTVSTRITIFQAVIRSMFWSVMPLIGFPPDMIFFFLLIHGAYPFFTHTQIIGKLGWIEYIFVTPSHHRVHHASNPEYLDKNFGDILIIWDKLFGTFVKETLPPVYGLTHPLKSYSFLWQHFHHFLELIIAAKRTSGWRNKIRMIFGKPELIDHRIRIGLERKLLPQRQSVQPTAFLYQYVGWQTGLNLLLLFFVILLEKHFSTTQLCIASAFILISVINTSAILEQRRWVLYLEYARLILLLLFINNYYSLSVLLLYTFIAAVMISYNKSIKAFYFQQLYRQ